MVGDMRNQHPRTALFAVPSDSPAYLPICAETTTITAALRPGVLLVAINMDFIAVATPAISTPFHALDHVG